MPRRFAILGLYNSGSSALAGMLHRLGANLGPPFWGDGRGRRSTVYEADDLARQLRDWWAEPRLVEQVGTEERRSWLAGWIRRQEERGPAPSGAKHPLLALSGPDVLAAWGPDTRLIWAWRPLAESVAGLTRRGWFPGREAAMQQQVWDAIELLQRDGVPIDCLDWRATQRDPATAASRLAGIVGLEPDGAQLAEAVSFVRGARGAG
jgi:hypothetical protein